MKDPLRVYTGGHRRGMEANEVFLKLGQLELDSQLRHPRRMSLPSSEEQITEAPVMVRKKSGELVKSCVKKRSKSAPATPTWPKYVHFDRQLEHAETPSAIVEDIVAFDLDGDYFHQGEEEEHDAQPTLTYPNWPLGTPSTSVAQMISIESVILSPDKKSLTGRVRVQNIAYQKKVMVRYTFDLWKTFDNVEAAYREPVGRDPQNSALDRFMFNIPIPPRTNDTQEEVTTMFFAVQYYIDNREFWDNNNGKNYQLDILRPAVRPIRSSGGYTHRRNTLHHQLNQDHADDDTMASLSSSPPSLSSSPNLSNTTKTQFGRRYNFGEALSHEQAIEVANSDPHPGDQHLQHTLKRTGTFPSYFSSIPGVATAASLEDTLASHIIHRSPQSDDQPKVNKIIEQQQHQQQRHQHGSCIGPHPIPSTNGNKPAAWTTGYFDLINKYCFYNGALTSDNSDSTTPSMVDPASVYGEPLVPVLVNHNVIQG
ncbi:hypothetical protein Unana1_01679 [Umbelopsis nana]